MSLFRRLVSQSAVIFGGRLFGAGLTFLVQAGIARFWGPSLLGEYLILVASTNLIAMVMPLGFQMVGPISRPNTVPRATAARSARSSSAPMAISW